MKVLMPALRQAEAPKERHGRHCGTEVSFCESRAGVILALLCAKQGEEGGDILNPTGESRANRTWDGRHDTCQWARGGGHGDWIRYRAVATRRKVSNNVLLDI